MSSTSRGSHQPVHDRFGAGAMSRESMAASAGGCRARAAHLVALGLLAGMLASPAAVDAAGPTVTISMPAQAAAPTCNLQYATQDVFAGIFAAVPTPEGEPSPSARLAQLDPPYWRVNSNSDGGIAGMSLPFPAPYTSSDGRHVAAWDFSHQVALLDEAPASVPRLLSISSPPDVLFTGTGPLGPSSHPGTLRDQSFGELAAYMAGLVRYYNTGILASGSGSTVSYTAGTIVDAGQDFTRFGRGDYRVTVDAPQQDGHAGWQTTTVTGVPSAHVLQVAGWSSGIPAAGTAFNLGSSTPPITSPVPATPWPRPPGAGPVRYWEIMNEPDLGNTFFPRASPAVLPPSPTLTGVQAPGGRLQPGRTYAYRLTAMNIGGVESAGGAETKVSLGAGQNAVRLTWGATSDLGLRPFATRIYGRDAGSEQAMVVVGRDAPGGLTWTDLGTVEPSGRLPAADQGTAGFQLFRANEYRRMWDVVVPAMKAIDHSIKVVGPTLSNPTSLANLDVATTVVTRGPDDQSYIDRRDYVQVLMARPTNPPDVISVHSYAGSRGSLDSDAALFAEPDGVAIKEYRVSVQPYVKATPVWETETNAEAGGLERDDFRGVTQMNSAWLAHDFARTCAGTPQVRTLFQYEYALNNTFALVAPGRPPSGCPPEPACRIAPGRPVLPYWTLMYLNKLVPRGSRLLSVSTAPAGFDVLAVAVPPRFTTVEALVVNHQVGPARGLGTPGALDLQLVGASSAATRMWTVDGDTGLTSGPALRSLGGAATVAVASKGYGVTFVEFHTVGGAAVPGHAGAHPLALGAALLLLLALLAAAWLLVTGRLRL